MIGAQVAKAGETPAGLASEDWAQMMRHLRESEYEVSGSASAEPQGRLQAPNRANGFRGFFDSDGVRVVPWQPQDAFWEAKLRLAALGTPGAMRPVAAPLGAPEVRGNRVEYRREGVVEWWVNRASGLEHGFTLAGPPEESAEQVRAEIAVGGGFEVDEIEDGAAVALRKDGCELRYAGLVVRDAEGRELEAKMHGAGDRIEIAVEVAEATWPVTVDPTLTQVAKLTAFDSAANDHFGISVAVSGDTAVAGADFKDVGANQGQGSAYVFVRNAGVWSLQQKLTASDGEAAALFGISVAVSGDTVVVGALSRGLAYVFVRNAGVWTEQQKLTASDGEAGNRFGESVTVSGDTAVVGAHLGDVGANADQGSAYVFVRNAGVWSEQQKITASDGAAGDRFGFSVAVSGDTAVVGAQFGDVGANADQGSAYVFERSAGVWSEQQKLISSDGGGSHYFGTSVALSGDTAVAGTEGQGSAYVFVRNAGVWGEQQRLATSDVAAGDSFGHAVAVSGDTAVVGAYSYSVGKNVTQGASYVFVRSAGVWSEQQKLTASDGTGGDLFGYSVAVSGDTAVIGARGDDFSQGSAYVFEPVADLSVTKTNSKVAVAPGALVSYEILASNAGPSAVTGATVEDGFPAALTGVTWTCAASMASSCGKESGVGNINHPVSLAVGGTATFTATGMLSASATGTLTNTATVAPPSGVSDLSLGNNSATDTDAIVPGAVVSVTKTVSGTFEAGGAIVYSVGLTNSGATQNDNPGDEFTDTLPAELALVSASATSGTVLTVGNTVTWNGGLATTGPGASVTITIDATINAGMEGAVVSNHGTVHYDADANGTNEASALTDDPAQPGATDPTVLFVGSGAVDFFTLPPCRILDTRNPNGPLGGPALIAQMDRTFAVAGSCGIPATAKAISVNLAVTQPTGVGHLRLRPGGMPPPLASSINYSTGGTRSGNAVVPLNASGEFAVFCGQASGTVHFILDVNGYFE